MCEKNTPLFMLDHHHRFTILVQAVVVRLIPIFIAKGVYLHTLLNNFTIVCRDDESACHLESVVNGHGPDGFNFISRLLEKLQAITLLTRPRLHTYADTNNKTKNKFLHAHNYSNIVL